MRNLFLILGGLLSLNAGSQNPLVSNAKIPSYSFFDKSKDVRNIVSSNSGAFFEAKYNHKEGIFYLKEGSSNVQPLVYSKKGLDEFVVSGNGKSLYFVDEFEGQKDIFKLDLERKNIENVTNTEDADEFNPKVDSSGNILVYLSDSPGGRDIFLYDSKSKKIRQVTHNKILEKHIDLSLDGKFVLYSYFNNSSYSIDRIKLLNDRRQEIVRSEEPLFFPQFVGENIFYSTIKKNYMYIYSKNFLEKDSEKNFIYRTSDVIESFKINKISKEFVFLRKSSKRFYLELCSPTGKSLEPTKFISKKSFNFLDASSVGSPSSKGIEYYFNSETFSISKL